MSAKKGPAKAPVNVEPLNHFLHEELSAVETYKLVLDNLGTVSKVRTSFESCLQSHQQRVSLLRAAIVQLGGEPEHGSAVWTALAQMIDDCTFEDKLAIAALEAGEEHTLADYRAALGKLDASARQLVEMQLLPKQLQSCHSIEELKAHLH
jgi:hypothetical protein